MWILDHELSDSSGLDHDSHDKATPGESHDKATPASWKRAEGIGIMSGRGSDRKKNFKKGVDTDESRRKREETRIVVQSASQRGHLLLRLPPDSVTGELECLELGENLLLVGAVHNRRLRKLLPHLSVYLASQRPEFGGVGDL